MQRDDKKQVITGHQTHDKDTGSFFVQIAIFTARIINLTEHLKQNPKDKHSRRGLLRIVSKRRKLLTNLRKKSVESYESLIQKLGIRK